MICSSVGVISCSARLGPRNRRNLLSINYSHRWRRSTADRCLRSARVLLWCKRQQPCFQSDLIFDKHFWEHFSRKWRHTGTRLWRWSWPERWNRVFYYWWWHGKTISGTMSIHIAVNERLWVEGWLLPRTNGLNNFLGNLVGAVPVWQTGYPGFTLRPAKNKSLNFVCPYYSDE